MSDKGGFIDRHFSFTGDGRTNGTEYNSSGLGDAKVLATKIVANVALQLYKAGWRPSNKLFLGDTATESIWIANGNNYIQLYTNTNPTKVIEIPMTFTKNGQVTKIWLMYGFKVGSTPYVASTWEYLGNNYTTYFWGAINSAPCDLSIIYCPPGISDNDILAKSLRIASCQYSYSDISGLANYNTNNAKYTYHVITKDNFIGIGMKNEIINSFNCFVIGDMIADFYDSSDTTCTYGGYIGITTQTTSDGYKPYQDYSGSLSHNINLACGKSPNIQFYNISGVPQCCQSVTNSYPTQQQPNANAGLFVSCANILRAMNTQSANNSPRRINYSKILIGNTLTQNSEYWPYAAKVSSTNSIKGTINTDYMMVVDAGFVSSNNSNTNPCFNLGQKFDNGNYIHIGSGVCIGWDSENSLNITDQSSNYMLDYSTTEP